MSKIIDFVADNIGESECLSADGLDQACVGVGYRNGKEPLLVYDVELVLGILCDRDGMEYDEAREYFDFNIGGAWMGPGTPIWMETCYA
jgi:hypothetical protein|tara:strand:- start:4253 stop:4519 length:267 start_codon:yes stop_codon:yes gene_type:complete